MISLCQKKVANADFATALYLPLKSAKVQKYDTLAFDNAYQIFKDITNGKVLRADLCDYGDNYNSSFWELYGWQAQGYMAKFGIQPATTADGYAHTFKTTYVYYWASVAVTLLTLLGFLVVVRSRVRRDKYEWVRIIWRIIMAIVAVGLIFVHLTPSFGYFIASPYVVLVVVILMMLTTGVDRICRFIGTRRFKKKFQIPAEDHSDGKHGEHEGFESLSSTLLSPMSPSNTRPPYNQRTSSQSDTAYNPAYVGGVSYTDESKPVGSTYTHEIPAQVQVYGTGYQPVYASPDGQMDIASHGQQPYNGYPPSYGAPVQGPYEPLRQ